MFFNIEAWFWIIAGDESQVYSSAARGFVPADDAAYLAWLEAGGVATRIASFDELKEVLRSANVPPYHRVPGHVIVRRLAERGKLEAARAAIDAADILTRELWSKHAEINADDPAARDLVAGLGVDPNEILGP